MNIVNKLICSITNRIRRPVYHLLIKIFYLSRRFTFLSGLLRFFKVAHGKFVTLDEYTQSDNTKVLYREKVKLAFSPPKFDQYASADSILIEKTEYDKYAVVFKNASILGNSNIIILQNSQVLYDIKSLDIKERYCYSDNGIIHSKRKYLIYRNGHVKVNFEEAIWMGGNFSWNYYHLLFEFLIKFVKLNQLGIALSVPVLIDQICLDVPQFLELLTLANQDKRQIIAIEKSCRYQAKELYFINCPNFIPPNFINDKDIRPEDVQFDIHSLLELRSLLLPYSSRRSFPKRFFISRQNASGRRIFNESEVFRSLEEFGFSLVEPEKLSIVNQIALFSQAEIIAGGSGAALTNLLFCSKNCTAIVFAKNRLPFSGFSTIAYAVGADLRYVTEESTKGDLLQNIHDPFVIDIVILKQIMKEWF